MPTLRRVGPILALCVLAASCFDEHPMGPLSPQRTVGGTTCPSSDPDCNTRPPNEQESQVIQQEITRLNGVANCLWMAAILDDAFSNGQIGMYDMDNGTWGDWHPNGDIHVWDQSSTYGQFENTLRHEAAHQFLGGGEEWEADYWMDECG